MGAQGAISIAERLREHVAEFIGGHFVLYSSPLLLYLSSMLTPFRLLLPISQRVSATKSRMSLLTENSTLLDVP